MKKLSAFGVFSLATLLPSVAFSAPVVSNLSAQQRAGTMLVDIAYDLASPFGSLAVGLEISSDAGANWTVPAVTVSGDVGASVVPGTGKAMVWDAGADWAGNYSEQMRFRVVADDLAAPTGFALIPGGSFTMGRTSGDTDDDAPPITVTVSTFYMSETETTKALWDEVRIWAAANGYSDLPVGGGKAADHPVQTVSWWDVVKWCNARSEKEGLTPVYTVGEETMRSGTTEPEVNWSANGHRLPTEAEWEKAARGGVEGKRFPWGTDTISHAEANYFSESSYAYNLTPNNSYHPAYAVGEPPYTSPVGSFAANRYGLQDMSGNVREWCWDWHGSNYYTISNGMTDPQGPASGSFRVRRDGSWYTGAFAARASYRDYHTPTFAGNYVGFRTARSHLVDDFALIPGGAFTMGRTSGDTDDDATPITVTVSTFYMSETETTKAQWDEVRIWAADEGYSDLPVGGGKAADHPVQTVTWWDVVKWCNARSEKEGLTPVYTMVGEPMRTGTSVPDVDWSANGYRLPTQAEWEKAARGGVSGKRFPWGSDLISHGEANIRNDGGESYQTGTTGFHPTYLTGGGTYTSPVGSFTANAYGLTDMAGNVFEWCWDWHGADYYSASDGATDPRGAVSGTNRVVKGGSWYDLARWARASARSLAAPDFSHDSIGFRVARSLVSESGTGSAETDDVTVDTHGIVAATRPDVAVGASAGRLVGRFVYAGRQRASLVSLRARPVTGLIRVANRGKLPDALLVRAGRGNTFFAVSYFAPGNVTARITAGTYRTAELVSGAEVPIRVAIKPNKKKLTKKKGKRILIAKKTLNLPVDASSTVSPGVGDAATIQVKTR